MRQDRQNLVKQLEDLLPQTQCTKCGFDGCTPYAEAMANGEAEINRCPPGGEAGIKALAEALNVPLLPLDSTRGQYGPLQVAQIDEPHCIGCTLCIQACPVDAIIGANKRMHTVLPDLCTGCELCVAPCPVDCIAMRPAEPQRYWTTEDANAARRRYEQRRERLRVQRESAQAAYAASHATAASVVGREVTHAKPLDDSSDSSASIDSTTVAAAPTPEQQRRAVIEAALARARARRATSR